LTNNILSGFSGVLLKEDEMGNYANVRCEQCGVIEPQNMMCPVIIDAENYATNDLSFGVSSRGNFRVSKQGDRTYHRAKRIFLCPSCYREQEASIAALPPPKKKSILYMVFVGSIIGLFWWVLRVLGRTLFK
jgi:hypothetical protein